MGICVVSFSSRAGGNCSQIGKLICSLLNDSKGFDFSDFVIHPCGECGYDLGVIRDEVEFRRDTMGDVIETPKVLISPRQALERFSEATGEASSEIRVARIERVALTYAAVRAENKQDGMVFAPVWQIRYLDKEAYDNSYPASSAQINAITGEVVETDF